MFVFLCFGTISELRTLKLRAPSSVTQRKRDMRDDSIQGISEVGAAERS